MIVVDSNVIAYLMLPSPHTKAAEELLITEPNWAVPWLWRSEMRNVLALYLRKELLTLDQACAIQGKMEELLADCQYEINSDTTLELAYQSGQSAYDCEFIALARELKTRLVTMDQKLLGAFPDTAVALAG